MTDTIDTTYCTAQAKAHDAVLAAATITLRRAVDRLDAAHASAHRVAGDRTGHSRSRFTRWGLTWPEVVADLEGLQSTVGPQAGAAHRALAAVACAEQAVGTASEAVEGLEDIWRRHGRWERYFSVPGGHIHQSPSCHSLRTTTRIGWLPELSGEPVEAAVAAHGAMLCSHCFPQAPTGWTVGARPPAGSCPGGGQWVTDASPNRVSPRGTCPACGQNVSVTARGNARRHSTGT